MSDSAYAGSMKKLLITTLFLFSVVFGLRFSAAQDSFLPPHNSISDYELDKVQPLATLGRGWNADVAWSPDGAAIAVGTSVGVWLYDADDLAAEPIRLNDTPIYAAHIAYSPDGKRLAAGDSSVTIWDTQSRTLLQTLPTNGCLVSMAFSPDSQYLVTSNGFCPGDYAVNIWDVETGEVVKQLADQMLVSSLTFSVDGSMIAGVSMSDCCFTMVLWDTETGEQIPNSGGWVSAAPHQMVWRSDEVLAIQDRFGSFMLYDLKTDEAFNMFTDTAEEDDWYAPLFSFTPDENHLISLGSAGTLVMWDADTLEVEQTVHLDWSPETARLSPDGTRIAGVDTDSLKIIDVATGEILAERAAESTKGDMLAISPDDTQIAAESAGFALWRWSLETGERLPDLEGSTSRITDMEYSPDGSLIAAGNEDGRIYIWDASTAAMLQTLRAYEAPIVLVAFEDDQRLLTVGQDGIIYNWNPRTGESIPVYYTHDEDQPVDSLLFEADHSSYIEHAAYSNFSLVVTVSGRLYFWRVDQGTADWELLGTVYPEPTKIDTLDFQWGQVLTGGQDNIIQLWGTDKGRQHGALTHHDSWIYAIAQSRNGVIASGGCGYMTHNIWDGDAYCDGTDLRFWDSFENKTVVAPLGHTSPIQDLEFTHKGDLLASISGDGTLVLWGVPAESE